MHTNDSPNSSNDGRRQFLKKSTAIAALAAMPPLLAKAGEHDEQLAEYFEKVTLQLQINGQPYSLTVEPRVTLLDLLREQLDLTGTKKGCDHGQCGCLQYMWMGNA